MSENIIIKMKRKRNRKSKKGCTHDRKNMNIKRNIRELGQTDREDRKRQTNRETNRQSHRQIQRETNKSKDKK
jgi:hypothetical protein